MYYSLEARAVIIPWKPGLLWAPDCACSALCLFGSPTWKVLFMKHLCPESRDKLIDLLSLQLVTFNLIEILKHSA